MPQSRRVVFTVAWDEDVDVAYLSPIGQDGAREVAKTVPIVDRAQQVYGTIDLAGDGKLLGMEIIGARRMLPELTDEHQRSAESGK